MTFVGRSCLAGNNINPIPQMDEQHLHGQEFLIRLVNLINANLGDENFGAKELAKAAGMSQRKLSLKLRTIKKTSVCRFICETRLQRAMEMLQKEDVTASEVAYKVGFASATYFNKCFHEFFGFPPGKIKKEGPYNPQELNPVKTRSDSLPGRSFLLKFGYAFAGLLILTVLYLTVSYFATGKTAAVASSSSSINPERSIAVLPFVNDSPDKENEYFCNGIMEEILNQLQKISDLKVKSRKSVEMYRNTNKDIRVIGHELAVSMIMEGSVRKIGDDLRIRAELIDIESGNHLWSQTYDGKYTTEVFEFQGRVAKKVAASLRAIITPDEEKRIDAKPTKDLLAHSLTMKGNEMGMKWWTTNDSQYLSIASNYFNEAMKIDPDYVDAKAGKGGIYELSGKYDSAMIYYKEVLKIDQENRNALEGLGSLYMKSNKPDSAIKYYQKQVDANPKDLWAYLNLGKVLIFDKNEVIKGLTSLQEAYDLGGKSNPTVLFNIGFAYFSIGEYTKALKYFKETLLLEPTWCEIDFTYYDILYIHGNYNEALNFLDSIQNFTICARSCDIMRFYYYTSQRDFKKAEGYSNKSLYIAQGNLINVDGYYDIYLNYLLKLTGKKDEAIQGLKNSIKYYEVENLKIYGVKLAIQRLKLAASYAMLGENKKALEYLSQLEKYGLLEYPITLLFSGFDNLRNDPEFKAIVKRIKDQRAAVREKVREMEQSGELNL
jgi:TolB-like protein/AraC-like DNA-binding protein/Tfp pilus assembly protein PilF